MRKRDLEVLDEAIRSMGWHRVAQSAIELLRQHDHRLDYVSPEQIQRRVLRVIHEGLDVLFPPPTPETD